MAIAYAIGDSTIRDPDRDDHPRHGAHWLIPDWDIGFDRFDFLGGGAYDDRGGGDPFDLIRGVFGGTHFPTAVARLALDFARHFGVGFDCDGGSGDPAGATPAAALSLVTPSVSTLPAFSVSGGLVLGTDVADTILAGGLATDVRGRGGNDKIVLDWDRMAGEPHMVMANGNGGKDTFVLRPSADPEAAADTTGCVINVIQGPGVSSHDRTRFPTLNPDTVEVAELRPGVYRFEDATHAATEIRFYQPDYTPLTRAQVEAVVSIGPDNIPLASLPIFQLDDLTF